MGIVLCQIVRNEAHVIERCLASARDLIDRWVIVDTGSTDGTQAVALAALEGIPGELHERPWIDFGANRSENLALAGTAPGDYLLILDADETIERACAEPSCPCQDGDPCHYEDHGDTPAMAWPPLALGPDADCYMVRVRGGDQHEFRSRRLLRAACGWSYAGAVHSIPVAPGRPSQENLDAFGVYHHGDGGCHEGRLEWALARLEGAVAADPADARSRFYLANTRRDLGDREGALADYAARAGMAGWDEEVFVSLHRAGQLYALLGDWPAAASCFVRALETRPDRVEPVYELARGWRGMCMRQAAYVWARRGLDRDRPEGLFVEPWVYEWGALLEFSISAWWIGERDAARAAGDQLLARDLPEAVREQVVANMRLS